MRNRDGFFCVDWELVRLDACRGMGEVASVDGFMLVSVGVVSTVDNRQ